MTRILVAEDAAPFRDTLVAILDLEPDLEVVAQVASGDRIVAAALLHQPDVALLDIDLPGTDGLTAAAQLRRRLPGCGVLILTALTAPDGPARARAVGVAGYLTKDRPVDELIAAVRRVARGERA